MIKDNQIKLCSHPEICLINVREKRKEKGKKKNFLVREMEPSSLLLAFLFCCCCWMIRRKRDWSAASYWNDLHAHCPILRISLRIPSTSSFAVQSSTKKKKRERRDDIVEKEGAKKGSRTAGPGGSERGDRDGEREGNKYSL